MADRDSEERRELRRNVKLLAVPWVMAGAIVLGGVAGWAVDRATDTSPLATLVGIGAGIVGGGYSSYRTLMKAMTK